MATYREFGVEKQRQKQQDLALRQQQGWEVAHQAALLLKEKFAVTKVILFGSLLDLGRMRRHSDIDLAVWGLAEDLYYPAVTQLLDLDPEFSVDLVQIESASPSIRRTILTTGVELDSSAQAANSSLPKEDQAMTRYAPLIGQVQQDLAELKHLTQQTTRLLQKVLNTGDQDYLGTVALDLHSFYTGAERLLREIAQRIDGGIPEGADWHRRLLRQMSAEIPDIRPPVITIETRTALDEYCSFRHVIRNIYTFNLRLDRVQQLAAELPNCYQLLKRDCERFCKVIADL